MSCDDSVMIPVVAYVIVKLDGTVCSFFINLDDLDEMRDDADNEIIKRKENIEYDAVLFEKVLVEERISHIITPLSTIKMNTLYRSWNWQEYFLEKEMDNSQQGDFGENYIMWRARDYGMRAFLVKSVGADIILQDKRDKK